MGSYEAALAHLSRAIELKPGDEFALGNRGTTIFEMGSYEAALADLSRAIESCSRTTNSPWRSPWGDLPEDGQLRSSACRPEPGDRAEAGRCMEPCQPWGDLPEDGQLQSSACRPEPGY